MQYLVSGIQLKGSPGVGEAKAFDTIPEAIKYIQKLTRNKALFVGQTGVNESMLIDLLKERLSTVSISTEKDGVQKCVITAF